MRTLKIPDQLLLPPYYNNSIVLKSVLIIEECINLKDRMGSMFLTDHMLLFLFEGTIQIMHKENAFVVGKNEMILLKKNISFDYHKTGSLENANSYDSLMIFLKDELLIDFINMIGIKRVDTIEMARITVRHVKEPLMSFLASVKSYLNKKIAVGDDTIRGNFIQALYDLAQQDVNFLLQLIQLKKQVLTDIQQVIEENYQNPLDLEGFAYLSGRSLSGFKRDFYMIYKEAPALYIRRKRLNKAKELLETTDLPVQDVCYSSGFDSLAHFSRLYKQYYGVAPSINRTQPKQK